MRTKGSYGLDLPQPIRNKEAQLNPDSAEFYRSRENNGVYREEPGDHSPWCDAFSSDTSVTQLVATFPFEHRSNVLSRWLGYARVDQNKLKRVLPVAHPYFEFMRCRKVLNVQGVKWTGTKPADPVDLGPAFPRPPYAEYDQLRMTFGFETLPFKLLTDAEITYEYERFVWVRTEPGFTSLFIEGGVSDQSFQFDAGLAPNGAPSFPVGKNVFLPMPRVLMTWYDVPLEWVSFNTQVGYYNNIYAGLNRVNDDAFFGYPKNTLLMDTPHIDIRPNPLPPFISTTPQFLLNITLVFHYFQPTPLGAGVTDNPGHNGAIFRGDKGNVNSLKWFPCSYGGTGTRRLYESYDYKKLFKKAVADPYGNVP